jgi:hypothetical protein
MIDTEPLAPDAARRRSLVACIQSWDPDDRPIHCSNCRHCLVSGDPDLPDVTCAQGFGAKRPLWAMIRSQRPTGFRAAADCPMFDSMGEGQRL